MDADGAYRCLLPLLGRGHFKSELVADARAPYVLLYSMQTEWILYVFRMVTSLGCGIADRNSLVSFCSRPSGSREHLDEVARKMIFMLIKDHPSSR